MCIIVICWPPLRTATPSEPVACKPFANGDIFNSPTAFRFARSGGFANGVMCESRPGAVLPLRSGADGALGLDRLGSAPRTPLTSRAECIPNMSSDAARNLGGQIAAGTRQALRRICCAPASFPQLTAFDSCSTMKAMFNGAVRSVRAE